MRAVLMRRVVVRRGLVVLLALCCLGPITGCGPWSEAFVSIAEFLGFCAHEGDLCFQGNVVAKTVSRPGDFVYLGAAAHIGGYEDTDWRTDVVLHNAGDDDAAVTVEALVHGADNSSPNAVQVEVGAQRSVSLADLLMSQFNLEGKAAVRLRTDAGAVLATNRTYNLLGEGNALGLAAGATFGQYIPARSENEAIESGREGRLIGLTHNRGGIGFRTNLGLVNLSGNALDVEIDLYGGSRTLLGTVMRNLQPFEYRQLTRVFELVTGGDVDVGYAVIRPATEGGAALAQASVVDNLTGDPVFVTVRRVVAFEGGGGEPITVVAAAHAAGFSGTTWRTDLEIHNPGGETETYNVELLKHGVGNASPRTVTRSIGPGVSVRHVDALDDLFQVAGVAALRVVPASGVLLVSSRTYNLIGAGNTLGLPAGATFGQLIPGVERSEAILVGEEGRLVHLANDPSGEEGFRTNLILVNDDAVALEVDIDLYTAGGAYLGRIPVDLKPREYRQFNKIFEEVTQLVIADGYAVVRPLTDDGAVFALASVIDNLTGDPVGMMAPVVRPIGADGLINTVEGLLEIMGGRGDEEPPTVPEIVEVIRRVPPKKVLQDYADRMWPAQSTVSDDSVTVDFGDGLVIDGHTHTGEVEVDIPQLESDEDGVSGRLVQTHRGHTIDGEDPLLEQVAVEMDLVIREDGNVDGDIVLEGGPIPEGARAAVSSAPGLTGLLEFDSSICLHYPVGGHVTLTLPGGDNTTVTFGPDCDGSYDQKTDRGWDWQYKFNNPNDPGSQGYIAEVTNARISYVPPVWFWIPQVGGTTFTSRANPGNTPPGVVVFKFPFSRAVSAAQLRINLPTIAWSYSVGHNYLLASKNGTDWVELMEVPAPTANGTANAGNFNDVLPASVLGGAEIWIRAELYSYGPAAPNGGTNTAELCRYDESIGNTTFDLQVRFAE